MAQYIEHLYEKYSRYVKNLEWHIKTNKPQGEELRVCEQRIKDFKEIVSDLLVLMPTKFQHEKMGLWQK